MLELTQPTRKGTTRHATIGAGFTDARVCGCQWRVKADDRAAWSGFAAMSRVDGDRRHGEGHVGVSVAVSTVGLALHLRRVVALGVQRGT
jgi:hypothetical protein